MKNYKSTNTFNITDKYTKIKKQNSKLQLILNINK